MAVLNEKVFYEVMIEYDKMFGPASEKLKQKLNNIISFHEEWNKINKPGETNVRKKLDKKLETFEWINLFQNPPENELEAFNNLFATDKNQPPKDDKNQPPKDDEIQLPKDLRTFYDKDREEVADRIIAFQNICKDTNKKGCPDYSYTTTYLWMYFPNDYVDYSDYEDQPEIIEKVLDENYDGGKAINKKSEASEESEDKKAAEEVMKRKILNFYDLLDQMSRYISDDKGPDGFLEKYRNESCADPQCYCDPKCLTLAEDIAYFIYYSIHANTKRKTELYDRWVEINMEPKPLAENVLFYGIPGAGKSYAVNEKIMKDTGVKDLSGIADRIERVIFHQDYTYSDFVGQILPKLVDVDKLNDEGEKEKTDSGEKNSGKNLIYDFVPGPFTRILKKAVHDPDHMYYLIIEEINRGNAPAIFGDIFQLLDRKDDGSSEYEITNQDIADAVFHDESSDMNDDEKNGERKVYLPANLTIFATMNTSDQNVFTLDTAFQRRWDMVLISSDDKTYENSSDPDDIRNKLVPGEKEVCWGQFIHVINEKILELNDGLFSSEDKRLGVYFVKPGDLDDPNESQQDEEISKNKRKKFSNKVLKYLWDDAFKMNRKGGDGGKGIFKSNFKSLEAIVNKYNDDKVKNPLEKVLDKETYDAMKSY